MLLILNQGKTMLIVTMTITSTAMNTNMTMIIIITIMNMTTSTVKLWAHINMLHPLCVILSATCYSYTQLCHSSITLWWRFESYMDYSHVLLAFFSSENSASSRFVMDVLPIQVYFTAKIGKNLQRTHVFGSHL